MKAFLKDFLEVIQLDKLLRYIFLGLGLIILVSTVANLAGVLYETTAPKAIIYAKDNDAGRGVQTTMLSEWYKSNHFAPYGNFYFRIANTIAKLAPVRVNPSFVGSEKAEIQHHYAGMMTSVLCLLSFCLFLSYLLTQRWDYTVWASIILFHLCLWDFTWVDFIFRVHPEHLLILMSGFAGYFTLKYSKEQDRRNFIIAGLFWGLAMAVKRSLILFVPSFIFLFLSNGLNKKSLITGVQFIGWMLLSYLLIGFPQNFGFWKHINFLLHESHNSLPATSASIQEYLSLILNQSKYLVLAFIPLHLLFGTQSKLINWKILVFILIAVLVLVSREMASRHEHHVMPHVAVLLIILMFSIKRLPVLQFKYKTPAFFLLSIIAIYFIRDTYSLVDQAYAEQMHCQPERMELLQKIKTMQSEKSLTLARDPYFPFNSDKDNHKQFWGITFSDLDQGQFGLIGVSRGFSERYLGEPYHHLKEAEKAIWPIKGEAAQKLLTTEEFETPGKIKYKRIHNDQCGLVLWEKI